MNRSIASLIPLLILAASLSTGGCTADLISPEFAERGTANPDQVVARDRGTFSQNVAIPVPSQCLGGTLLVTGTISGWFQNVATPNGHLKVTEHIDFSQLTASFDGKTWSARPGSHEIWSNSFPPGGDAASVIVHEGRTRFHPDDGEGTNLVFVHRIHRVFTPAGEFVVNNVLGQAFCYGSNA